jgi:hypothetical protein
VLCVFTRHRQLGGGGCRRSSVVVVAAAAAAAAPSLVSLTSRQSGSYPCPLSLEFGRLSGDLNSDRKDAIILLSFALAWSIIYQHRVALGAT